MNSRDWKKRVNNPVALVGIGPPCRKKGRAPVRPFFCLPYKETIKNIARIIKLELTSMGVLTHEKGYFQIP